MKERTAAKPIIRRLGDIEEVRGVCGFRRSLITAEDTDAANVSHLVIDDSKEHYHREMTEFYYVLSRRRRDGPRWREHADSGGRHRPHPAGVRHTSEGEMEVLIVGVPPQEDTDIYFD